METGEDDGLAPKLLDIVVIPVDDAALFKVFVAEEIVADEQFLDGLHGDAAEDFLLTIGDPVFVLLHDRVKLLEHFLLADGFGVLHLADYVGVGQHFIEAGQVAIGALCQHDLAYPLRFVLVALLLQLRLHVPQQLVVDEARASNHEALDPFEIEGVDSEVALVEESRQRLPVYLLPRAFLGYGLLNLLFEQGDRLLDVAKMGHPLLHHHCRYLEPMLVMAQFPDEVDLVGRPLVLEDSDLSLHFDLKSMKLAYFQEVILLGILAFDGDAEAIFLGEVADVDDQQGEGDHPGPDLLESGDVGVVDDLALGLHTDVVALLDEVVDVPKVLVVSGHQCHVALAPSLLDTSALNPHGIEKRIILFSIKLVFQLGLICRKDGRCQGTESSG